MHPLQHNLGFPKSDGVPEWSNWQRDEFRPVSRSEFNQTADRGRLHEMFDANALKHPDRLAVVGSVSLSYLQLYERSIQAARTLAKTGVQPGDIVCVVAKNDWDSIAAMIGILRLGAICNLSDPDNTLLDSGPLIASRSGSSFSNIYYLLKYQHDGHDLTCSWAKQISRVIPLDSLFVEPLINDSSTIGTNRYSYPAFVFFTSGSTGAPQAVAMSHPFVMLDIARQINDLAICPSDRFDLLFSPDFSALLAPTFGALLSGASLWIRSLDHSIPIDLIDWLIRSEISISTMSVSVMRSLLKQLPNGQNWPSLRLLSVGGEPLRASDVSLFQQKTCVHSILQNAMATTETRTYAQYFFDHQSIATDPVPIGYPVLGRHVEILDDDQKPTACQQIGQVRISSKCLAEGYCADSREVSTGANPFQYADDLTIFDSSDLAYFGTDSLLYHVGRRDSMVKIRGQKVFLNEIESEVLSVEGVSNAFAFAEEKAYPNASIAACVESTVPDIQDIVWTALLHRLPRIAQPSMVLVFEKFPQTSTGKIDRQSLRQLVQQRNLEINNRSSPTEADDPFYQILSSMIKSSVGPYTPIRSLCLDSIASLDFCIQLDKQFSKRITWADIQSCVTCGDLAHMLDTAPVSFPIRWLKSATVERPSLILFTSIAGHFNQFNSLVEDLMDKQRALGPFGIAVVESGRMKLPKNTPVNIENFAQLLLEPMLDHSKQSPLVLAGHSWGGLVAFEIAKQLQIRNYPLEHLVLLDTVIRQGVSLNSVESWLNRFRNLPYWLWHDACQMGPVHWKQEIVKKLRRWKQPNKNDNNAPVNSLYDQQYQAASGFCPSSYHGQTTVIRASAQSLTRPVFGALGWESFVTPEPRVRVVRGNHLSILNARNSKRVSQVLLELIESSSR